SPWMVIMMFWPGLDPPRVKSATYRPLYKQFFWIFVAVCILLGWFGSKPPEGWYVFFSRLCTFYYFAHFLIVLPLLGLIETPRPVPHSISEAVLKKGKAVAAVAMLALAVRLAGLVGSPSPAPAAAGEAPPAHQS